MLHGLRPPAERITPGCPSRRSPYTVFIVASHKLHMKTFDFTVFSGLQATTRSARLSSQTALALGHKVAAGCFSSASLTFSNLMQTMKDIGTHIMAELIMIADDLSLTHY